MTESRVTFREPAPERTIRLLVNLCAALLLAVSAAMVLGVRANAGLLAPDDPVLGLPLPAVFLLLAGLGFGVALVCLFGESARFRLALVLWLALDAAVYAWGLRWTGGGHFSPYVGGLAGAFGLSPGAGCFVLAAVFLCLLTGSAAPLLWLQLNPSRSNPALLVKMACPGCGGHIQFAMRNLGRQIPCPHCRANLTLRKPEDLKMPCFFCHGHIEFPAHALGTKLKCPHCHRDITLKETATK